MRTIGTTLVLVIMIAALAWYAADKNLLSNEKSPVGALTVNEGEEVPFTIPGIGVDDLAIVWDFGDGTPPVEERSPVHIYDRSGTYEVTITAPDSQGTMRENTLVVTVKEDKMRTASSSASASGFMWSHEKEVLVTGYTSNESSSNAEMVPIGNNPESLTSSLSTDSTNDLSKNIAPPVAKTNIQSELVLVQQILAYQIVRNPILQGAKVYIQDCPNNWQGCAFYESGTIWIDPDHSASLEKIIIHECNHIIDWRQDGDIDYNDYHD